MAYNYVNIPRGAFLGFCTRPDPTPVTKDEVARFYTLLDAAVAKCTHTNVKDCTVWVSSNVLHSSKRMDAFAKYLAALSTDNDTKTIPKSGDDYPDSMQSPASRKSLHLLYILNDIFHHAKHHASNGTDESSVFFGRVHAKILPHISTILEHAGRHARLRDVRSFRRIGTLLDIWAREEYYDSDDIAKLRSNVGFDDSGHAEKPSTDAEVATHESTNDVPTPTTESKAIGPTDDEDPMMIPAMHGDPNTPYYDLPAGCMIPHIVPGRPIDPALIKPLQFNPGPAPPEIAKAVRDLIQYANDLYEEKPTRTNGKVGLVIDPETNRIVDKIGFGSDTDIDLLGQRLVRSKETGEMEPVENYYGWSIPFCRVMQRKQNEAKAASAAEREDADMENSNDERDDTMWDDEYGPGMGFGMGTGSGMDIGMGMGMGMGAGMSMGTGNGMGVGMPSSGVPSRRGFGRGGRAGAGGSRGGRGGYPY